MSKIQKETNDYILYSPDSLRYITDNMYDVLESSINFYKELFEIKQFRKIQINYFDDLNEFREYIYNLRGKNESLPSYAKATFDKGMINAFIENNLLIGSPVYIKKLYMASHELFHIMYKELIWEKANKPRVVWFDEGMAQLFSGEYNIELSDENFDNWFNSLVNNTHKIPDLNKLNHRSEFETANYSGYRLSLLAVKFLYETLPSFEFKRLMHNADDITSFSNHVLNDAFAYYKKK